MRPLFSVIRLYFSNLKPKFTNILGEENKLIKIKTLFTKCIPGNYIRENFSQKQQFESCSPESCIPRERQNKGMIFELGLL